jgi:GntR family transcriptional regulator
MAAFTASVSYHPSVPRHHQVQLVLRAKIESGEWGPEEQIPTEMALVRRFRVSRATVREALRVLERDGLVVRHRGRGTFARSPRATDGRRAITNLVLGYEAEVRVLDVETVAAPGHVTGFLEVARGEPIRRFVRVEVADGAPLAVVVNYVVPAIGRRIRAADLRRYSMLEFLRDRLQIRLGPIRQSIEARLPDDEVASLLGIDLTQPVLGVRLMVADQRGRLVEVADTFYRADRYRYEVEMPRLPERQGRQRRPGALPSLAVLPASGPGRGGPLTTPGAGASRSRRKR